MEKKEYYEDNWLNQHLNRVGLLKKQLNDSNSIPKLPEPPLCRVIKEGAGHFCNKCNSTSSKVGFLGLFGERLCDNPKCPNSKSNKNYR